MGLKGGGGAASKGNAKAGAKSAGAAGKGKKGGKGGKKGKGKGAKKKKCNKKVSQKKYDKLRKKTPNASAVKAANTRDSACIACGVSPAGNLAADHVVPMKQITQMDGFACMKEKDQVAVLNDPRNFRGLCTPCNSSKCAKSWNEWNGHSQKGLLPGVKGGMTQSAASLQGKLAASIAGRW